MPGRAHIPRAHPRMSGLPQVAWRQLKETSHRNRKHIRETLEIVSGDIGHTPFHLTDVCPMEPCQFAKLLL